MFVCVLLLVENIVHCKCGGVPSNVGPVEDDGVIVPVDIHSRHLAQPQIVTPAVNLYWSP